MGSTRVSAATAMKLASPVQRGTQCTCRWSDCDPPAAAPRFTPTFTASQDSAAFSATLNDTLLETSLAYINLLRAMQQQAIAEQTLRNAQQLADLTKEFARVGQGTQADVDRAQTELVLRQNNVQRAEEGVRVASARLAELLSVDANVAMRPEGP